jgi:hypothetical protein
MTEYLDFAVGAAILAIGYLGGRIHRPRKTIETPGPVCACRHTLGEHASTNGRCLAEIARPHYQINGNHNGKEWAPCACLHYVGPEPLGNLFAPTYLPPTKDD